MELSVPALDCMHVGILLSAKALARLDIVLSVFGLS